jgi:UTP--glucose-1-phosphate uridylyltransferase
MFKIRKAVFPVAGIGTRFLPATKATPKEMMPIVDKPLIQYAVEEAIQAGIRELIFVTSSTKRAIEDHFDNHFELETKLKMQGKEELLRIVRNVLPEGVSCAYIRQSEALGLGHAILCAKYAVGDEPFVVLLADDLMHGHNNISCLKQMIDHFSKTQSTIVAVEKITPEECSQYGVVGVDQAFRELGKINKIIEKPPQGTAPSNWGVVGRYILTPDIFTQLEKLKPGTNGEIQLTDAIATLLMQEPVYALEFLGKRYDCGSKIGYLKAIVSYGLRHTEVAKEFECFLNTILTEGSH